MRLHRHDEIEEAIVAAIDGTLSRPHREIAAAALDALLEAAQQLGVGFGFVDVSGPSGLQFRYPTAREVPNTFILRMEASDDK